MGEARTVASLLYRCANQFTEQRLGQLAELWMVRHQCGEWATFVQLITADEPVATKKLSGSSSIQSEGDNAMSDTPTPVSTPEMPPGPERPPQPFAERLSDTLQHWIGLAVGSQRKPPRRLKSLLNGTWFGHPLHPVITDVPITAWALTAIFDILWLVSGAIWAAYGAFVAVIAGLLGAVGAVVTGLTDWSDTYGSERRVGLNHALFNAVATVLYLISFVLRLLSGPGDSIVSAILGFVGLASVSYAAYLGGEMVFTKGTGVNHTAWEAAGEEYESVMPVEKVEEGRLYRVTAAGDPRDAAALPTSDVRCDRGLRGRPQTAHSV